jgi:uncharacterized HAD superfamily protein
MIVDIDGTLVLQTENYLEQKDQVIAGTLEKLKEWEKKNYRLILITGRKEGSRRVTMKMLDDLGIHYDQLIMGVGIGPRVLINDVKPEFPDMVMAEAYNLKRNAGITTINT